MAKMAVKERKEKAEGLRTEATTRQRKPGRFWRAAGHSPFWSFSLPPDRTPLGSIPVGVRPFSVNTLSLSSLKEAKATTISRSGCRGGLPPSVGAETHLSTENTRAIFPMARILLRITSLRAEAVAPAGVRGHTHFGSNFSYSC